MRSIGIVMSTLMIAGLAVPASALPDLHVEPTLGATAGCSSRWVDAQARVAERDPFGTYTLEWKGSGCEPSLVFNSRVKVREDSTGIENTCLTSGGVLCETQRNRIAASPGTCINVVAWLYPGDGGQVLTDYASACAGDGGDGGAGGDTYRDRDTVPSKYGEGVGARAT